MNPVRWIARRVPSLRRDEEECREGRRIPSWECGIRSGCESVRLTDLDVGTRAVVTCLEQPGEHPSRKLAGLGILPGVSLELIQGVPVFVLRLGHTELALDHELASRVRVRPEGERSE